MNLEKLNRLTEVFLIDYSLEEKNIEEMNAKICSLHELIEISCKDTKEMLYKKISTPEKTKPAPTQKDLSADEFVEVVMKEINSTENNITPPHCNRESKSPDVEHKKDYVLTNATKKRLIHLDCEKVKTDAQRNEEKLHELDSEDMCIKHIMERVKKWEQVMDHSLQKQLTKVSRMKAFVKKSGELNLNDGEKSNGEETESINTTKESSSVSKNQAKKYKNYDIYSTINKIDGFDFALKGNSPMVTIGPNGTKVSRNALKNINWGLSGRAIARKLLCLLFDRNTIATHTLTGRPSPAFLDCNKEEKGQLDPLKISDLTFFLTNKIGIVPREIRIAITTKCADEQKRVRKQLVQLPPPGDKTF